MKTCTKSSEEEELIELVEEARQEALEGKRGAEGKNKSQNSHSEMVVLACCVCTHHQYSRGVAANVFHPCGRIFEDIRRNFSQNEAVQQYKQAVVVIETENSKGTGFSFNERGDILTNYHVVKGELPSGRPSPI